MKTRAKSQSFLATVLTLLIMAAGVQGIQVDITGEQVVQEILAKNWDFILNSMLPAVGVMVFKLYQKIKDRTFQWNLFFKDANFMTFALTIIIGLLNGIGFVVAQTASAEIAAAIASGSLISIGVAVLLNIANPLWHFIQDWLKKNKPEGEKATVKANKK